MCRWEEVVWGGEAAEVWFWGESGEVGREAWVSGGGGGEWGGWGVWWQGEEGDGVSPGWFAGGRLEF